MAYIFFTDLTKKIGKTNVTDRSTLDRFDTANGVGIIVHLYT